MLALTGRFVSFDSNSSQHKSNQSRNKTQLVVKMQLDTGIDRFLNKKDITTYFPLLLLKKQLKK